MANLASYDVGGSLIDDGEQLVQLALTAARVVVIVVIAPQVLLFCQPVLPCILLRRIEFRNTYFYMTLIMTIIMVFQTMCGCYNY